MKHRHIAIPSLAALALALVAAAPLFGPPSIRVSEVTDTPPTPGAVLSIVATHHTDEANPRMTARAEGVQGGKRVSQPIVLTPAAQKGHFGVTRQWEAGTPWVLVFTIEQGDHGEHGKASALVKVDARGRIVATESLMERNARGDRFARGATDADVTAALASLGQ